MLRKVSRRHHYGGSSEEAGEGTRGAPAAPEATEKVEHLMNELAKKQVWDDVPSHQNFKWLAQMTPIEATEGSFENACRDPAKINRVFFLLLLGHRVFLCGRASVPGCG